MCEQHQGSVRQNFYKLNRFEAARAANYHDFDDFPGRCYIVLLPSGLVKIGFSHTADLLKRRLSALKREYGPLVVLADLSGGFVREAVLHQKFDQYRVPGKGELFLYSYEIAEYVSNVG